MTQSDGSRYYFRANAAAFGGVIQRPTPENLETHGATSLPIVGGYASARSEKFRHREMFSFEAAYSQVTGTQSADGKFFDTLITSTVEGLNIAGMVTADRVVARLSASHPNADNTVPEITLVGSHFVNLRIAGCLVHLDSYASLLNELDSNVKLVKRFAENPKSLTEFGNDAGWSKLPRESRTGDKDLPECKGVTPCSLFKNIRCSEGLWTAQANSIVVPQFGTVYLGEVLLSGMSRRLTMLRVDMGCPIKAQMSASIAEGDGHRVP